MLRVQNKTFEGRYVTRKWQINHNLRINTRSEDADQRLRFHCARQPPPHSSGSSSLFKMASIENRRGEDPGDEVAVYGASASNVSTLDSVFNSMYAFPMKTMHRGDGVCISNENDAGGEGRWAKTHWQVCAFKLKVIGKDGRTFLSSDSIPTNRKKISSF